MHNALALQQYQLIEGYHFNIRQSIYSWFEERCTTQYVRNGVERCMTWHVILADCRRELNRASARRVRTKSLQSMEDMKARLAALEEENASLTECALSLKIERSDLHAQVNQIPRRLISTACL